MNSNALLFARPGVASMNTFGGFNLTIAGHQVQRWHAGKARALLQYLMMRPGRVVSRESLNDALWPDLSYTKNASSLKVAVHALRSILASSAPQPPGSSATPIRIVTHEVGYSLETEEMWVDFWVFDDLINQAQQATARGQVTQGLEMYRQASDVYRGDFLPGVTNDWAEIQREWLRSRALCTLEKLTERAIDEDDHLTVISRCHQMLDIEPFREETYHTLMLIHAQLGQLGQVERWYRLCKENLNNRLQLRPSDETEELFTKLLRRRLATNSREV